MQVIHSVNAMQSTAIGLRSQGKLVGFVPTMGALHEGHLSLVDVARERSDVVVLSIFVNPIQFGPNEDFDRYPRELEADLALCRERDVDIVFVPHRDDILPKDFSTHVVEEKLSRDFCGVSRPGHFRGVCTIVNILFNIVRPDLAVFGQKDAQQSLIIKKMVADLHLPVEVVVAPTCREPDGLAMSSRNKHLHGEQRNAAAVIYQAMMAGKKLVDQGIRSVDRVVAEVSHTISLNRKCRVIYVSLVDRETLTPSRDVKPGTHLLLVAVWVDEVRLIDNCLL